MIFLVGGRFSHIADPQLLGHHHKYWEAYEDSSRVQADWPWCLFDGWPPTETSCCIYYWWVLTNQRSENDDPLYKHVRLVGCAHPQKWPRHLHLQQFIRLHSFQEFSGLVPSTFVQAMRGIAYQSFMGFTEMCHKGFSGVPFTIIRICKNWNKNEVYRIYLNPRIPKNLLVYPSPKFTQLLPLFLWSKARHVCAYGLLFTISFQIFFVKP